MFDTIPVYIRISAVAFECRAFELDQVRGFVSKIPGALFCASIKKWGLSVVRKLGPRYPSFVAS